MADTGSTETWHDTEPSLRRRNTTLYRHDMCSLWLTVPHKWVWMEVVGTLRICWAMNKTMARNSTISNKQVADACWSPCVLHIVDIFEYANLASCPQPNAVLKRDLEKWNSKWVCLQWCGQRKAKIFDNFDNKPWMRRCSTLYLSVWFVHIETLFASYSGAVLSVFLEGRRF